MTIKPGMTGAQFRKARLRLGLRQTDLAATFELSIETISRIETGRREVKPHDATRMNALLATAPTRRTTTRPRPKPHHARGPHGAISAIPGHDMRRARHILGWTLKQLGQRLGVTENEVWRKEKGHRTITYTQGWALIGLLLFHTKDLPDALALAQRLAKRISDG